MISRAVIVVLTVLLVASAMALVTSQYRARGLFAELDLAQTQAKSLEADGSRLRVELGRAAQPAAIEASARAIGMRPVNPDRTVFLPTPAGVHDGSAR